MSTDPRPPLRLVGPDERAPRRLDTARWGLAVVAVSQIVLGVAQLANVHLVDVVNGGHLSNESAAWNIALGAALAGVARTRRCSVSVLAILTAFIAMLTLLTVTDLTAGRVGVARLGTHGLLLLGYLLVVHLNRRPSAERPVGPGTSPASVATNEGQTFRENGSHAYR